MLKNEGGKTRERNKKKFGGEKRRERLKLS